MKLPFFVTTSSKKEVILSVRFVVLFGMHTLGFQSVSDIGKVSDVKFINEGGRNDYPLKLRMPQSTPHKLTFKRGYEMRKITLLDLVNPWSSFTDAQKTLEAKNSLGTILILNDHQEVKAMYSFISQGLIEWTLSELDAEKSAPLIETFTISHNGLKNLPIPSFL